MRYAIDGRPVLRLVFELFEDSEALPEDADRLTREERLSWNKAEPPSEVVIERARRRLCEIAGLFWRDIEVLYERSVEGVLPAPLRILGEDTLELFRPMQMGVRVERIGTWDRLGDFPGPEEVHGEW
ncbi:MAG: hypothetical protein IH941_07145 [Acidobacteria bacterium]|nr:hypothetical protein [Acidobacteriota bacterium]